VEHGPDDDCFKYSDGAELRVIGERDLVGVEFIGTGQFVQEPNCFWRDRWAEVHDTHVDEAEVVHLLLFDAPARDVTQARKDACEGHETTRGAIGDTYFCDGSCIGT
jgi:hypothetical protein